MSLRIVKYNLIRKVLSVYEYFCITQKIINHFSLFEY